jgi:hypothetical protein
MHLIIDADPIVYASGYAAETINYQTVWAMGGDIQTILFRPYDNGTAWDQIKEYQAKHPEYQLLHKEKLVDAEPVSHALMIVKQTIDGIKQAVGFKKRDTMTVLLSGPGNYRERIATYKEYKGNRDPEHKPVHYQAIRDYLTSQHGAVVVHGHEADDEASIIAHSLRRQRKAYVIASIDKDLQQIPGTHFDYRIKQLVNISEAESRAILWRQALSGDSTDNIPGACKIGAVKAQKHVEAWIDYGMVDKAMWHELVRVYADQADTKGCYYCKKDAEKAALENMRLVYLQREPNELWVPPGAEPEYLEVGIDD